MPEILRQMGPHDSFIKLVKKIGVQWVIESYSLLLAALLLVGGSMGDRYGRRRIFVIGVMVFAAASAACGFAVSIGTLIAARAVQGIGAALLVPGSLAIISNSFGEDDRGRAIETWSDFSAITAAIGPVLGGRLVETVSWRAVFFINLPVAILVILISFRNQMARLVSNAFAHPVVLGALIFPSLYRRRSARSNPPAAPSPFSSNSAAEY